jgi:hypothetical protein
MRRIPLLLLALSGCTFVSQTAYQNALCRLDEDGDGDPRCGISNTTADGDCDDSNPSMYNGNVETPYDGFDNDCSGGDLLDVDGDGYAGITREAYEALPVHEPWQERLRAGLDCHDLPIEGFPQGFEADVYPGAAEIWYDGVDGNCDGGDDFDQDGDGFAAAEHAEFYTEVYQGTLPVTDCLDNDRDVYPGSTVPNEPYDGIDQDCGGTNDFDPDGDGRLTAGYNADAATYASRYGYDLTWIADADCMDVGDLFPEGPTNPTLAGRTFRRVPGDETCAPGTLSCEQTWYDGYDDACDDIAGGRAVRNDFDQDADGFLRRTSDPAADRAAFIAYVQRHIGFTNARDNQPFAAAFRATYGDTPATIGAWYDARSNDCEDVDPTINPRAIEKLGDSIDGDCDGDPDTTGVAFGPLTWLDPGPPRATATPDHLVLVAAAQDGIDFGDGFDVRSVRSVALSWAPDAESDSDYVLDEAPFAVPTSSASLDARISVYADADGYITGHSWYIDRNRLVVTRASRDLATSANYRISRTTDSGTRSGSTRAYVSGDLRCDSATGRCWTVACDDISLHFMEMDQSSSLTRRVTSFDDAVVPGGIADCVVLPSAQSAGALTFGALGNDGRLYAFEQSFGELFPSGVNPFPTGTYDFARSHQDWIVLGRAAGGLTLYKTPTEQVTVLPGTRWIDADAVVEGSGSSARWTIVAARADGTVTLAYGTASSLATVDLPIVGDRGELVVDAVSVAVGSGRVLVGVRGDDGGVERIGWALLDAPG